MRNLDVCRKIYSRARSSEQNDASVLLAALQNALHFTFAAAAISRDHDSLWYANFFLQGESHSAENFDWAADYFNSIHSDDQEAAYDILLLLGGMRVRWSPAKQHMFIERLIAYMDNNMPRHLRHAALRAARSAREEIVSIDAVDDARLQDMVLTQLSPAILSVVCPHPDTTPVDENSDRFFDYNRDSCYLELVCALAKNSKWHPHLSGDHHIDRCISMIPEYCQSEYPNQHAFYIAGILLQITPEQASDTSLDSVTEQQWWDVMRYAWKNSPYDFGNTRYFEILVLVDGTKKYMQNASKSDLEQLVGRLDFVLEYVEEMQRSEQVKELRTVASNMLESFGQQLPVAS
ncbi:uncharacterized protein EDB93DRAFT_1167427 [Suillus bovinus]|uniref:uncharacterized protein n=1 Tax=Suillus bovinus TaxID=48563 RepID=UPI001B87A76F|nr:uncharacterized protein EDB93DRAFT_1167427 [Suillus bovinus]KAG2137416.1 hypothetical protein EDB93DRAFT_1167427 [Suillus bovinus]